MPATLTVDTTGQIRVWSQAAEQLLGYSRSEAVGKSIEIIIPPHLRDRHRVGFGRFVQTRTSTLPEVAMSISVHKTGKHMKIGISVKALYGDEGKIIGVEATLHQSGEAA